MEMGIIVNDFTDFVIFWNVTGKMVLEINYIIKGYLIIDIIVILNFVFNI